MDQPPAQPLLTFGTEPSAVVSEALDLARARVVRGGWFQAEVRAAGFDFTPNNEAGVSFAFVGANAAAPAAATRTAGGQGFFGDTYSRLEYQSVYPGIDVRYDPTPARSLEYTFVVHPGASPETIRMAVEGADGLSLSAEGDLILDTSAGSLASTAPVLFQEISGVRVPVAGGYQLLDDGHVGFWIGGYNPAYPLTIDPELEGVVTIEASGPWGAEEGPWPGDFTFRRTGDTTNDLTVNFAVGGTAGAGSDYQALGSSVTIPAGSDSVTLSVDVLNDTAIEGTESVLVTLAGGSGYTVGTPNIATVNVVDDDVIVSVTATDPYAWEPGSDAGTFTVTRNYTVGDLTVYYRVGGTALPDSVTLSEPFYTLDYVALPGSVTIPNGQTSATVTVTPLSDSEYEPNEVVLLTLVTGEYAVSATAATAGVRIYDEEPWEPPVNVAPVAGDDTVLTSEGTPKLVKVLTNDGDYDYDPVSVVSAGSAAHGTVEVDSDRKSILYTPTSGYIGSDSFTYTITDHFGGTDTATVTVTVAANTAPIVTSPGNQSKAELDAISLQVVGSDPQNDEVTYSATGLPPGLYISSSGEIFGLIDQTAAAGSPYAVTVTASDGRLESNVAFSWTVADTNYNPYFYRLPDQISYLGQTINLQLYGYDPEGDALTYQTTGYPAGSNLVYEVTGLPDGLTISPSGLISGTPVPPAGGLFPAWEYLVSISVKDPTHGWLSDEFIWTVVDPAQWPLVSLVTDYDQMEFSHINPISADRLQEALDQDNGPERDYLVALAEAGAWRALVIDGTVAPGDEVNLRTYESYPYSSFFELDDVALVQIGANQFATEQPIISYTGTLTAAVEALFPGYLLFPDWGMTAVNYQNQQNPPMQAGRQRTSVMYVAVGDSITAGVSHAVLRADPGPGKEGGQHAAYPTQIADRLGMGIGKDFRYPNLRSSLVDYILPEFDFGLRWHAAFWDWTQAKLTWRPSGTVQGYRRYADANHNVNNFAVPGAKISDLTTRNGTKQPGDQAEPFSFETEILYDRWTLSGRTQVEWANRRNPSLVTIFAGNNDAFATFINPPGGNLNNPERTTTEQFQASLEGIVQGLRPAQGTNFPDLMLATLPDVTAIPLLVPIGGGAGAARSLPPNPWNIQFDPIKGTVGGRTYQQLRGDPANNKFNWLFSTFSKEGNPIPDGSRFSLLYLVWHAHEMEDTWGPDVFRLPNESILTPAELTVLQQRVNAYNEVIKAVAFKHNIPVVDINGLFSRITNGITIVNPNNQNQSVTLDATAGGGIFSSDGIHPLPTGQTLIANEFIDAINAINNLEPAWDGFGGIRTIIGKPVPWDILNIYDPFNPKKPN